MKKICPKCKKPIKGYPAISRIDNKTEICSKCGIVEALEEFFGEPIIIEWDDRKGGRK